MPWNDNSGGWQSGRGPWGQRPSGGGPAGGPPPNLEEILRRGQDRLRGVFPGGLGSRGIAVIVLLLVLVWLASGIYRVQPDEQGVELRFGEFTELTQPGLNYHLPVPIETVETPKVTRVNRVDVGFRSAADLGRPEVANDVPEESLMLTGDENIVDVDFAVFWVIDNAANYLFNIQNPEATVKAVAESVMREVVGRTEIQPILTEARSTIESAVHQLMQDTLDSYQSGIRITQVQLQKVDPPAAVIDAFRDVQAARADLERQRNEAEAYANDIIPRARGEAAQIFQEAEAYRQQIVAEAQGDAQRFLKIYDSYKNAKDVTQRRIYLETMEQILANNSKIIIDSQSANEVVPYLPLPELQKRLQSQQGAPR